MNRQTFADTVRTLAEEQRLSESGPHIDTARRLDALYVCPDLFAEVYLTPNIEAISEIEGEIGRNAEWWAVLPVLAAAARRFPSLAQFLPQRPENEPSCRACSGTGQSAEQVCRGCWGLGWDALDER